MSLSGNADTPFAPLSGEETIDVGQFNDIEVYNNIYLKEATDTYTGYNVPLITTNKSNDDMIFNTTTLSSNWDFTVGTGQDTKESIFRINPTTGLHFEANNNAVNIDWNELSYLNGARSNIQAQLDNLDPDLSSNQGYWGNFWNGTTITNSSANAINTVAFPSVDANNYGFSVSNSNRIVAGHAGIYMFISTIQINKSQGSTAEDIFFWIRQNGVDVPDTAYKETVKSEPVLSTANWQLKMNAGDYFQIMWSSPDIHVQLVAYAASSTPTKPAIPSVILTASQVSFLVAGGAGLLPLTYNSTTKNLLCDASFQVVGNTDLSGNTTKIRGNLDLLGRMTNSTTKLVICDSSYQVLGNTDLSGNTKQRGNIDISGALVATGSTFSYVKGSDALTVTNRNWTDGSGAAPAINSFTTMFGNVKNQTIDLSGWRFSGTAVASVNGYAAWWCNGILYGYDQYGGPSAGNGPYYMIFVCYSPGSTQSNSTFYLENRTPLSKGIYQAVWQSKFNAGTQYSTTSLSVSLNGGTTLLQYNDSDTRSTNIYRQRSLIFEVTQDNSYLRWTFKDTQATANRLFAATIQGLTISKYNGITVTDPSSNTAYITPSISQLYAVKMVGANEITGTLAMTGIPSFYSSKGANNVAISTQFTQAALATQAANNIAIGSIAYYAENFTDCTLIGQNAMTNDSQQQNTATQSVGIGNNITGPSARDVVIGYGVTKTYVSGYEDCVLIGWGIGNNFGSIQPFKKCTALGSSIWRGYYQNAPTWNATPPEDNVAIGYSVQTQHPSGFFGSFNTAVGTYSGTFLSGNATLAAYNTTIGYYSGVDPSANALSTFREIYYAGTYIGAWARSKGNIANIKYATALGYGTSADASYCTVIGAEASYNVANTIRLGRSIDTTVASHLTVNGNTSLNNLTISGTFSQSNLSTTGNLSVDGNVVLCNGNTKTITANGNFVNRGDGWSIVATTGNVYLSAGLNMFIDCGTEGGINYGVYNLVTYIKARDQVCYDRGTQGVNAAANAQSTADGAAAAAAAAGTVAAGAAAVGATNTAAITALTTTVTAQGVDIAGLDTRVINVENKTDYMLYATYDTNGETTNMLNRMTVETSNLQSPPSVDLRATGISYFNNGLESKTISTTAGQVQNLRGSTVNIGDSSGAVNIDSSNVSVGNVTASTITIGNTSGNTSVLGSFAATGNSITIGNHANGFTNVYGSFAASGYTNILGNTTAGSTTTIHGDAINMGTGTNATITIGNTSTTNTIKGSNISIGALTSTIYINGVLYVPFNPASLVQSLAQWT